MFLDNNQMCDKILNEYPDLNEEDLFDSEEGEYYLDDYPEKMGYDWVEGKGWQHEDDWIASGNNDSDDPYPIY